MKKQVDFHELGAALLADTQVFVDTYAARHPADGPLLAFCFYFDSQLDGTGMLLPAWAVRENPDITVSDVAAWYYYADHVQGELSEPTRKLFRRYEKQLERASDEETGELAGGFHRMVTALLQQLSFEKLPRTGDFVFFAAGMDEDYADWQATIPPDLLDKHFNR